jgi:hypothetical protein
MAAMPENTSKFLQDTIRHDQMLDHFARNDQIETLVWFQQDFTIEVDTVLPIESFTSSEGRGRHITTMNDDIETPRSDGPCQSTVSAPYIQDLSRT